METLATTKPWPPCVAWRPMTMCNHRSGNHRRDVGGHKGRKAMSKTIAPPKEPRVTFRSRCIDHLLAAKGKAVSQDALIKATYPNGSDGTASKLGLVLKGLVKVQQKKSDFGHKLEVGEDKKGNPTFALVPTPKGKVKRS